VALTGRGGSTPLSRMDNIEIVWEMLAAFGRGDYEQSLRAFDPEVEGDFTHMPDGRMVRGREGIREEVGRWRGTWSDLATEYEGIGGTGDKVVIFVRQSGIGKGSGAPMAMRYGQVFTIRDGAIAAMKTYLDREHALKDAGLDREDLITRT
jgi:ketosteroid isomerase-like protein